MPVASPPFSLPANSQFLRLCQALHKRKNWLVVGDFALGKTRACDPGAAVPERAPEDQSEERQNDRTCGRQKRQGITCQSTVVDTWEYRPPTGTQGTSNPYCCNQFHGDRNRWVVTSVVAPGEGGPQSPPGECDSPECHREREAKWSRDEPPPVGSHPVRKWDAKRQDCPASKPTAGYQSQDVKPAQDNRAPPGTAPSCSPSTSRLAARQCLFRTARACGGTGGNRPVIHCRLRLGSAATPDRP